MAKNQRYQAVLLFGGPGCGKGTQGAALAGLPNICHLAMGDIFRALDKQSDIGKEFLSYSTKGLLVPDELTLRVWKRHVEGRVAAGDIRVDYHILLLDGIPRTTEQVERMSPLVDVKRVVHLVIRDDRVLVARLKGRAFKQDRPDDMDESVIRRRIAEYQEKTAPVLAAYPPALVSEINADQSPFAVLRDIAGCLAKHLPATI